MWQTASDDYSTPLPPGATVRPPFFNPTPRGRSSGSVVWPAAIQISAQQRLPVNVFQHSGGPRQVASKLVKVFLKATCKGKKEVKKFTLHNVNPTLITSSNDLKDLIKMNLHDDIKCGDYDVGYMVGTAIIRVRTKEDLKEMWGDIKKSQCTTLWCDGLVDEESGESGKSSKSGCKRKRAVSDEESDDEEVSLQRHRRRKR